MMIII